MKNLTIVPVVDPEVTEATPHDQRYTLARVRARDGEFEPVFITLDRRTGELAMRAGRPESRPTPLAYETTHPTPAADANLWLQCLALDAEEALRIRGNGEAQWEFEKAAFRANPQAEVIFSFGNADTEWVAPWAERAGITAASSDADLRAVRDEILLYLSENEGVEVSMMPGLERVLAEFREKCAA